jgi:hypothetical protein
LPIAAIGKQPAREGADRLNYSTVLLRLACPVRYPLTSIINIEATQPASGNQYTVLQEGALPKQTREQAAEDAGLSERQARQVSVAKITLRGYCLPAAWCLSSYPHRAQCGGIFGGMCGKRRRKNLVKTIL